MRIINDTKLDFKDVLILPKRSTLVSRKAVSLERTYNFHNGPWTGVPIIAANMDGVGTFEMASELAKHKWITALTKHYAISEYIHFYKSLYGTESLNNVAFSIGLGVDDLEKFEIVKSQLEPGTIRMVCIDVANGYTETFVDFCKKFKQNHPDHILMAGNVVTPEITEELILNGVDLVKIGIGSGSVCLTRSQTGVGYPQLSAIIECADAAHGLGGFVVSDGGCTCPGDIAKAFAANADFVMLGGMLAGHAEGCTEHDPARARHGGITFYGMSSKAAMTKHHGEVAEYRSSEGKEVIIKDRGKVSNTVLDIMGGVRSSCTYVGAKSLKELSKRTTFVRVTQQLNNIFS